MKKLVLLIYISSMILNSSLFAVKIYSATEKGSRLCQEDVVVVDETLASRLYCGIFDGHGGSYVALDLKSILLKNIIKNGFIGSLEDQEINTTIAAGFLSANAEILNKSRQKVYGCNPGSTALISFVLNKNKLVVANAGDCRAVLCKNGHSIQLTKDHKATVDAEIMRIYGLGGVVFNGRAGGVLAVSRAFGDFDLSLREGEFIKSFVSPNPDVFIRAIEPVDEFLIMASDGLWDVVENQLAVEIVKKTGGPSERACIGLIQEALKWRSQDNISVVIIDLKI